MKLRENVSLKDYSTMRLGGMARFLVEVADRNELKLAVKWAKDNKLAVIVIGGGSNLIWNDNGFDGLVIVNKIMGFDTYVQDDENLYLIVGAGEDWDDVVKRSVELGYSGLEPLSLIPGTAGATPIQNVGAYGREIADVLVSAEVYDSQDDTFINLRTNECGFSYRSSRFKTTDKGRFYISAVTLHVTKTNPQPPFYAALQEYFDQNNITEYTPQVVRDAVIAIRSNKLPDPAQVANNGSFFANPIVDMFTARDLSEKFPGMICWDMPEGTVKLSAGWLVEQAGFKGVHDDETGMATWDKQALVLVNEHAGSTADLIKFKQKIVDAVQSKFGVTLEQEPEIIS